MPYKIVTSRCSDKAKEPCEGNTYNHDKAPYEERENGLERLRGARGGV